MTAKPSDTPEAVESSRAALEDWLIDNRWPSAYDLSHALMRSDWLARDRAQQRAEAWDEGMAEGLRTQVAPSLRKPNPYRAARTATPEGGQHE